MLFLVGLASLQAKRFSGITYQYTIEILVVVDKTAVSHAYYVVTCHVITVMPLANSLTSGPVNILQYCPPSRHGTARMWHVIFSSFCFELVTFFYQRAAIKSRQNHAVKWHTYSRVTGCRYLSHAHRPSRPQCPGIFQTILHSTQSKVNPS